VLGEAMTLFHKMAASFIGTALIKLDHDRHGKDDNDQAAKTFASAR
jgi:hypothetical protein